jgi:hypothetical protein
MPLLPPGKQTTAKAEADSLSGMTDKKSKGKCKGKNKRRSFDFATLRSG